ncbi:PRC-barrel domain-containing protein [Geodermatophilus sp. SYSU D01119]
MTLPDRDQVTDWIGKTVVDRDGNEIGTVTALLADDDTGQPEWLYADHAGSTVVVPLVGATGSGEHVQVAVERGLVDGAPRYGESRELSTDQEAALYRHYGIEATTSESDSLLPAEGAEPEATTTVGGPNTDPVPLPDAPADAAPVAEELPAPPPVAQPGDRDFGRAEQPAGGGAGRIGAAVAAALAVGAVVFTLLRRRQKPPARASRGARRTARKAQRSASRTASRAGRKAGRKAARARRSAASVPATGRARLEQVTAAAAPVVTGAVHQVREATRSGAAAAVPAVSGAVHQVRETARSGAAAAGPAVSNAAAQVLGATRSGAAAAAPLLATTGHALQTGANAGAEVARQALEAGAGLAAAAVTKAAEAGAELGQSGLRAAMRAERAVGQVPEEVAEAGHRLKKKGKRLVRLTALGAGLGTGYVVGAGYGDYGQIQQLAGKVTGRS